MVKNINDIKDAHHNYLNYIISQGISFFEGIFEEVVFEIIRFFRIVKYCLIICFISSNIKNDLPQSHSLVNDLVLMNTKFKVFDERITQLILKLNEKSAYNNE